jgi:hypothetical protein
MQILKFIRPALLGLLLLTALPGHAAAAALVELVYDREVPPQARANIEKAIDTVADLLTKHNLILRDKITVIVTADLESYTQARMLFLKEPRATAAERAKYSGGVSAGSKPIIIVRGSAALNTSPAEAFRVLPHEIFHQVQHQYGHTKTVSWLTEGTPEVFQFVVREAAGLEKVSDNIRAAEQRIRQADDIPDARQLASYDYNTWHTLMQKYPVYPMAVLMTYKLIQDNGFENVVFFYQMLHNGTPVDKAFHAAFRAPMAWFLSDMNEYFSRLRSK